MEKAVAYIRVSSQRQVEEGSSLDSQTRQVETYAKAANITLVRTFREEGESAKTDQRPRLQEMLRFCMDRKNGISIVIVPKIDRLARNVNDYTNLKLQLSRMGIRLESLGERIDDTPVGRFTETILASVAQFDNEIRAERSKGGMIDAVSGGRWVWKAPVGYRNTRYLGKGTIEPDPQFAPVIQQAFSLIAGGHQNAPAVREFLANSGVKLSPGGFYKMIHNEVYLGRIHAFGKVHPSQAPFVPLIDEITFYKAAENLENRHQHKEYKLDTEDFPLRGSALCPCQRYFSGSWSRGEYGRRYAYYRCPHCGGKSFPRVRFHSEFLSLLDTFKGNPEGWDRLKKMMVAYANEREEQERKVSEESQVKMNELHKLRDAIAIKNASGVLPDDVAKRHIDRLTAEMGQLACQVPDAPLEIDTSELVDFARKFFSSLKEAWDLTSLKMKKDLLRYLFPNGVLFYPDRGFRTLANSLAERFSQVISGTDSTLVDLDSSYCNELREWLTGIHRIVQRHEDQEVLSPSVQDTHSE